MTRNVADGHSDINRTNRNRLLRDLLEEHRRVLVKEIGDHVRDARETGGHSRDVMDEGEQSSLDMQDEVTSALLQMRHERRLAIDAALRRLDAGTYGQCAECEDDISEARLQALPFAVRCTPCEQALEQDRRALLSQDDAVPFRRALLLG